MRCGHRPSGTVPRPETRDASALIRRRSAISAWLDVASGVSFRQGLRHASLWGVTARKRTELRRASDGGADSAAISSVLPCASVRADRMWICRIGIDSKFGSIFLRFISIFERGARVLSFPINPPKGERSRPFRRRSPAKAGRALPLPQWGPVPGRTQRLYAGSAESLLFSDP